jgi:hypothetical protein
MNGEQGSPVARKTRVISRGLTRFPQLNLDTLGISSILIDARQGYALHCSKRLKADSSATWPDNDDSCNKLSNACSRKE